MALQGGQHRVDVAAQVLERALQLKVAHDAQQGVAQAVLGRAVGAVGRQRGRLVVFNVLGLTAGRTKMKSLRK